MAHKIRWSNEDKLVLNKAINNFNKKIARLNKQNKDVLLPEKISKVQIKHDILTRRDYKNLLKSLQRFTVPRSEIEHELASGQKITTWEHKENIIKQRSSMAILNRKLHEMNTKEVTLGGIKSGLTYGRMGSPHKHKIEAQMEAIENIENKKGAEYLKLRERLHKYSKQSTDILSAINYKKQYLKSISLNFRNIKGYQELMKKIREIPDLQFYELIKFDDIASDIHLLRYDSKGNQTILERTIKAWEQATGQAIFEEDIEEYVDIDGEDEYI